MSNIKTKKMLLSFEASDQRKSSSDKLISTDCREVENALIEHCAQKELRRLCETAKGTDKIRIKRQLAMGSRYKSFIRKS